MAMTEQWILLQAALQEVFDAIAEAPESRWLRGVAYKILDWLEWVLSKGVR